MLLRAVFVQFSECCLDYFVLSLSVLPVDQLFWCLGWQYKLQLAAASSPFSL